MATARAGEVEGQPVDVSFTGQVAPIPPEVRRRMIGSSWHPDPRCPPFESLRLLTLGHRDLAGQARTGELVVAAEVADEVVTIFERLFALRFPIARMEL